MNLDFLCLTKRDLENQRFDSLCGNGAGSPNFYLAQTCHPRVWYCSRSFAIGTAYESIHTFVFSHEKSLIRDFRISSSSSFFFCKRPRASKEGVKPLIFIPN